MQTSTENIIEFDAYSGWTLPPPDPWQTFVLPRSTLRKPQANQPQPPMPRRRQDVCPNADMAVCALCHAKDHLPDHDSDPKCQICGLDRPTASKDCRKKLRKSPRLTATLFESPASLCRTPIAAKAGADKCCTTTGGLASCRCSPAQRS
ncbi:hypothetical protein HPB48_013013 [Haemaphysalis longicornis]|uniref:Uncharacterized protein n=1 Tax=Haemaphysalis longicornis TaxID=44386 RepID=A0A9J6FZF3_HAELO|nr:hypothetical protein HPB48_013013 [Haemaphysalis longicornis]